MFTKTRLAAFAMILFAATAGWAGVEVSTDSSGVILNGYDAVAYFTQNQAVEGRKDLTAEHAGATYRFSSAENRAAFLEAPERFAPAYGGYCAYGASLGKKFPVDGEAFEVVDGVLYVNKNLRVKKTWVKDIPGNISKADQQWPKIERIAADDL